MSKSLRHDLTVQMVKVEDLVPWERNPRQNDAAAERLAYTIQEQGWTTPILVQRESGRIIGGHTRLKAAIKIGLTEVPVIHLDVEDRQADAIAIADNRLGEIAEWDNDELARLLEEIEADGGDLLAIGYNDADWSELLDSLDAEESFDDLPEDVEPEEPPEDPVSRLGEVYELGPHRLVCGDSTLRETVMGLMGEDLADCVFTDPPYGVNVQGGKGKSHIAGDLTQTAIPFSFELAVDCATKPSARLYFCGGEGNIALYGKLFERHLRQMPRMLIWVKNGFVMKPNGYHNQYELIFHGYKPGGGGLNCWFGGRSEDEASDVWQISRDASSSYLHPTQKPVALALRAITNSTPKGGIVFEPFGGSGSTLIAAAKCGRVARLIELDPGYCDVIRKRWTKWAREAGQDPGPGALD
jgi:16S rRNA G966 N2-methylase RsmD